MCIMILVGSDEDDPKLAKRLEIYPLSIIFGWTFEDANEQETYG